MLHGKKQKKKSIHNKRLQEIQESQGLWTLLTGRLKNCGCACVCCSACWAFSSASSSEWRQKRDEGEKSWRRLKGATAPAPFILQTNRSQREGCGWGCVSKESGGCWGFHFSSGADSLECSCRDVRSCEVKRTAGKHLWRNRLVMFSSWPTASSGFLLAWGVNTLTGTTVEVGGVELHPIHYDRLTDWLFEAQMLPTTQQQLPVSVAASPSLMQCGQTELSWLMDVWGLKVKPLQLFQGFSCFWVYQSHFFESKGSSCVSYLKARWQSAPCGTHLYIGLVIKKMGGGGGSNSFNF